MFAPLICICEYGSLVIPPKVLEALRFEKLCKGLDMETGQYLAILLISYMHSPCRLDQYAIAKFAESFEMVPKTLAENAGLNAMEIISSLYAEHASGNTKVGIDLDEGVCKDMSAMSIWDLYVTKYASSYLSCFFLSLIHNIFL